MSREEHKKLMMEMYTKSKEEVNEMFNSGVFNEIAKGYVARLLSEHIIFGDEAIEKAMSDMDRIFDEMTASEAREFYKNF